jgi:uncharacterized membrane protein
MDTFALIKTLHILSATILFGTGLGTAFFMFRSHYSTQVESKFDIARAVVLADYWFTAPAVLLQPVTGIALIAMAGYDPFEPWLVATYVLFVLAGLCWLPVVWIQIELRKMLRTSLATRDALPDRYRKLFRIWFWLGWPAFLGLIAVFYLMVHKPTW